MNIRAIASPVARRTMAQPSAASIVWPIAAIVLMMALHFSNALGRAINWDEFYHYSLIHQLLGGQLAKPLQTLHSGLFSWVTLLPGDNIAQIIAARIGMLGFTIATAYATYALARGFTDRPTALLCALAWLSAGFVLQHATSFRTDAMAAALLMGSLAIMTNSRLRVRDSLACAALAALAALITMKSVLYAPAFAVIAFLRWQEADRTAQATLRLAALAIMVPVLFGLFYLVYSSILPGSYDSQAVAAGSAKKMFQVLALPYWHHAVKAALTAPVLTIAIAMLPIALWKAKAFTRDEKTAITGLALPLTSVLFYHNSAAYYYVFILPPVAVASCVSLRILTNRYSVLAVSIVLSLTALSVWFIEERDNLDKQRRIVAAADEIFGTPVAYFDFPGMIGHFPKANGFLTPWGAEAYRNGFGTSMSATLEEKAVPLVLENDPAFTEALRGRGEVPMLLDQDVALLRDTYIPFWGPYWLAGETLPMAARRRAQIRVPGTYTVRDGALSIDGLLYLPGEVVNLKRQTYLLTTFEDPARLIWGERLSAPNMPPPQEPYWTQF